MPPKILVITGPTATGKTALGVTLAKMLDGEVVSADSMQVYRGMDIGTAKPGREEMQGVIHHMLDVASPFEAYSAARYVEDAAVCIAGILARGRLPILVGGTGLYIDSLVSGRDFAEMDTALRSGLSARYDAEGGAALLEALRAFDPESAARLHPHDKKRILRAMEIYLRTGETITAHDARTRARPPRYDALKIALTWQDRGELYARIHRRVDEMMARGLPEEVRGLLDLGLGPEHTAMQAIGYKEMAAALLGGHSVDEAAEVIKMQTRRYAKRQLSWLRRDPSVCWVSLETGAGPAEVLQGSTYYLENNGYNKPV